MKQVPVLLKNGSENVRHSEKKTGVWNIGKPCPLLPLPLNRRSIAAAWARLDLASVINEAFFCFGSVALLRGATTV
jgi:hypothetical protein